MNKNIEEYFNECDKIIDSMSDEEFMDLLIKAGLNNCPLLKKEDTQ